jgi:type IV pilus assembly protein PilF
VRSFSKGLGLMACFCLAGCPQYSEYGQTPQVNPKKLNDAAQYNTQLGIGYLNQGDEPRAKRKLLTALRLAPDSPDANAAMGYFLEKTHDQVEASTYYKRALALAPKSGAQQNNYGAFLCRTGKYKEAMKLLLNAGEDVHYVNSAMAYENAGLCAELMHDHSKSKTYFLKALTQDSSRKLALYEFAKLSLQDHEAKQALEILQRYAQLTKEDTALLALGIQAAKVEENEALIADYQTRLNKFNTGGNHEHDRVST